MRLFNEFELKDLLSTWQPLLMIEVAENCAYDSNDSASCLVLSYVNGFVKLKAIHSYSGLHLTVKSGRMETASLFISDDVLYTLQSILNQK
jgi:hypothetical protein